LIKVIHHRQAVETGGFGCSRHVRDVAAEVGMLKYNQGQTNPHDLSPIVTYTSIPTARTRLTGKMGEAHLTERPV
jgi:hypothetical protein